MSLIDLNESFQDPMYMARTGKRYQLTEEDSQVHCSNNNFHSSKSTTLVYIVIIKGPERSTLCVSACLSLYLYYSEEPGKMLANALTLIEISISPSSVLLDHGYKPHAGSVKGVTDEIQYHIFFTPV